MCNVCGACACVCVCASVCVCMCTCTSGCVGGELRNEAIVNHQQAPLNCLLIEGQI